MVQRCGDEALKSRKGKASESMKHTKKELYYVRMDRDIAKKAQALFKAKTKIVVEIRANQKKLDARGRSFSR